MRRLGAGRNHLKQLTSWSAEQLRRLRPSWLGGQSGVGLLEELELLTLGVSGKLALWEALRYTHSADPRLAGVDLDTLADRARAQIDMLIRRNAAADTFSDT